MVFEMITNGIFFMKIYFFCSLLWLFLWSCRLVSVMKELIGPPIFCFLNFLSPFEGFRGF